MLRRARFGFVVLAAANLATLCISGQARAVCGDWDGNGFQSPGDLTQAISWAFNSGMYTGSPSDADVNGDCYVDYGDVIVTIDNFFGGGTLNCTCSVASSCVGMGDADTLRIGTVSGAPGDTVRVPVYAWSDQVCDWMIPLTIESPGLFTADTVFFGTFGAPSDTVTIDPNPDFLIHSALANGPTGTRFSIQLGLNELFQIQIIIDESATPGSYAVDTTFVAPAHTAKFYENAGEFCVRPIVVPGAIEVVSTCDCPSQGDVAPLPSGDGFVNIFDVISLQSYLFESGNALPTDEPICPLARADIAPSHDSICGDGIIDMADYIALVRYNTLGGDPPCDPCTDTYLAPPPPIEGNVSIDDASGAALQTINVGISMDNDRPIMAFVFPLVLRSTSGGAFYTDIDTLPWNLRGSHSGDVRKVDFDLVDYNSPDQLLITWNGLLSNDVPSGADVSPSIQLAITLNNNSGTFEIDTLIYPPTNRLMFVSGLTDPNSGEPMGVSFDLGTVTITGGPMLSCENSVTTPFLYLCPGGEATFSVELRDDVGDPVVGNSSVSLDFTDCAGDIFPLDTEHPDWPIVDAPYASDDDGRIDFSIVAAGDCPSCSVDVYADCGLIATIPVTSGDLDLDSMVTPADFDSLLGLCRDLNADGIVDHLDLDLHSQCLGGSFPGDACDRMQQSIATDPNGGFVPGDMISVIWNVTNFSDQTCTVNSVDFYDAEFGSNPNWQIFASLSPNVTLDPGDDYDFTILSYTVPDYGIMSLRSVMTADCCTTSQEFIINKDVIRACPPDSVCYDFYAIVEPADDTAFTPSLPSGYFWSWEWADVDTITNGMRVTICTSDVTPLGISGGVNLSLLYGGIWAPPLQFRVRQDLVNGDVTHDCVVNVLDVVFMIDYVFRSGDEPDPLEIADVTFDWCEGVPPIINVLDVVYMIDYVFRSGPPPEAPWYCEPE